MTTDSDLSLELGLLTRLCDAIGTPRALCVKLLIENQEWDQLLNLKTDPNNYTNSSAYADDRMVTDLLSKSTLVPLDLDLEAECRKSFRDCEARNAETNARLSGARHPGWFYDLQARVRTLMGNLTPAVLSRIISRCGFGPGVTVGVKSDGLVKSLKYDAKLHLTHSLMPFRRAIMGDPWWSENSGYSRVVKGNQFFTVPKNAKALRGCCKEPTLNGYLQMGIGAFLTTRLGLFGVNLRDQSWNQFLASRAHCWNLATLDLKNASDLMARACVFELVTPEWCHLLELARSPFTLIEDEWVELEKHSSMGNGYTFPLETLIFKALVDVSVDPNRLPFTAVYGDDIVVPQEAAQRVIDRLEYLGFQVNRSKSHLAGDFFESCGRDFFRGVDVRPFYARRIADGRIPYALQLANALRRYAAKRGALGYCDPRFMDAWKWLISQVPHPWRKCRVPDIAGDVGILSTLREARARRAPGGLDGWQYRHVVMEPIHRDRRTYGVLLAAWEQRGTERLSYGLEPMRGYLGKPAVRVGITQWSPGFEWL